MAALALLDPTASSRDCFYVSRIPSVVWTNTNQTIMATLSFLCTLHPSYCTLPNKWVGVLRQLLTIRVTVSPDAYDSSPRTEKHASTTTDFDHRKA